ncbi:MAG: hypothetical protein ACI8QS_001207 [Planctomycetota bacterium]|jgi:hypothetical protein
MRLADYRALNDSQARFPPVPVGTGWGKAGLARCFRLRYCYSKTTMSSFDIVMPPPSCTDWK